MNFRRLRGSDALSSSRSVGDDSKDNDELALHFGRGFTYTAAELLDFCSIRAGFDQFPHAGVERGRLNAEELLNLES